ncbi:helix-turn-helix transcriptional regulator [Agrococcus carbonis]|uniref:Predicted transcriptional regulator, ArsR family n=1 Tax=Agrococcus carbonis TaxID=684552 RepID=A0A1H1Q885_9MICO|nr:helix-turn-helix domain-containing protein [Agrococcus carbonis]SDS19702.1 Predicted transcriptional regulator, ArsR family [Agrococcus carbonis]
MTSDEDVTAVGAIADDARRRLYRYVIAQPRPVGREEAAEAVGMPVHRARFHLEKLEDAGLLETDYARPAGRSGPGAGRPAKRYRRAEREVAVSLPPRQYDLAGAVLAEAIDTAAETGEAVTDAVARVAEARGRALVAGGAEARGGADAALTDAAALLAQHGYEPRRTDRGIELANCPFHELSRTHTRLVCGMNEALLTGVAEELAPGCLRARLDPAPGRCCVVIEPDASAG